MQAGDLAQVASSYTGHYHTGMLLMSVLIVSVVALVAFYIAMRVQRASLTSAWIGRSWWLMGSIVMGLSIWSAHFICLLAFEPPVPVSFGLGMTLLSVVPAILVSALLLRIRLGFQPGQAYQWVMATTIGAGFVLMHYMAVQAMRMEALLIYDAVWLSGFVLLCIVFSFMANALKFKLQGSTGEQAPPVRLLLSLSLLIAILIVSVNLVATRAVQFYPVSGLEGSAASQLISPQLLFSVATSTVAGILVLLLASVQFGYRMDSTAMLRDAKALNQSVLDHSMDAIVSTDRKGRIRGFNASAESLFGYQASSVIGKKVSVLLSGKLREMAEFRLTARQFDASPLFDETHEITACRSDGSEFPARVRIAPVTGHGNLAWAAFVHDISRQRRAELERFQDQQRLDSLLCASPVVIYTRSVTGSLPITWVSPCAFAIFGIEPDRITGNPGFWAEQVHPDDGDTQDDIRRSLRKNGKVCQEYRVRHADGSYRWISDAQSLICDEQGDPAMLVGYWTDIHQRKSAQQELELMRERLAIGIDRMGISSWDWIMQSGELRFSAESVSLLGLTDTSHHDMDHLIEAVHSEDRSRLKRAFREALVSGDALDEEYRVVWPDRSIHWIHAAGRFINNANNEPVRMVGVMTDISSQKQLHVAAARIA